MTKEQSHVMLVLHNMRMKLLNMRKKIKEPLNVTKVQLHVMLVLHNVRMNHQIRQKEEEGNHQL